MNRYRVAQVTWSEAQTDLANIRREVFIREQQVPEEMEWDRHDPEATHFLAYDDERAVGTVRLLADGKITRMAVLKSHRQRGLGAALLRATLALAQQRGKTQVYLEAQITAKGFYQKFGFSSAGEVFLDAGIPHQHMILTLGGGPVSEHNDVIPLTHPSDVLPLLREFAGLAQRTIDIFSHQLNPALYDDAPLIDHLSNLARRGHQARVRVLVRDPRSLYGCDRPLLTLIQRLPSHMHIRVYTDGASGAHLGFFCVDAEHLVHFADEPAMTGFARRGARAESRQLLTEFEHLWLYGSRQDDNLRRLSL